MTLRLLMLRDRTIDKTDGKYLSRRPSTPTVRER